MDQAGTDQMGEGQLDANQASANQANANQAGTDQSGLPPVTWANFKGHMVTITKHKLLVMQLCFRVGLYRQGLVHDFSKYTPTEFMTGARFYQGTRSPNAAERDFRGFTEAWLHHKGRNRHHFEYWLDAVPDRRTGEPVTAAPMPTRYIVEMFCDRVAACKVYQGDAYTDRSPLEYFLKNRKIVKMHPDTMAILEGMLEYLAENGEERTLVAVRKAIVEPRWSFGESARF